MITPKEIENKTMSQEKREMARRDIFGFYIGRPITYVLTIPFLYTNVSPNIITYISFIPTILGFVLLAVGRTKLCLLLGWLSFFVWSMLDGIDGNIARYKKQFSKFGDTLDAAAGYFAMALIFFGAGIAAEHDASGVLKTFCMVPDDIYIVLGGISGMSTIMPRLVLHKAMTSTGSKDIGGLRDRTSYSMAKVIVLNLISVPGLVQLLLLLGIFTHTLDIYTVVYFLMNLFIMFVSLRSVFQE